MNTNYSYWELPPKVTERNGWTWDMLVSRSPFRVEQETFPTYNSGYKLEWATPCTDGETLWVPPYGGYDMKVSYLFHEMAHAFLHYPNGKDEDLIDPLPRIESIWEFEACLTATQVIDKLKLVDDYNYSYMRNWFGNYGKVDLKKVVKTVDKIVKLYK